MNPTTLTLENVRSYRGRHAIPLPDGLTSIIGEYLDGPEGTSSNGTGKSTIALSIDVALFGAEGRESLAQYLTHGEEELVCELTFEHAGEVYRVRRGFSARTKAGKPTVDFERYLPVASEFNSAGAEAWLSLTCESIAATQAALDSLLGFNRATFRASSMLLQGAQVFAELKPDERIARIIEMLHLERWKHRQEAVRAEARGKQAERDHLAGGVAHLAISDEDRAEVARMVGFSTAAVLGSGRDLAAAEAALEIVTVRFRELEGRVAERRTAQAERDQAAVVCEGFERAETDAAVAAGDLPALVERIADLEALAARGIAIVERHQQLEHARADWQKATAERTRWLAEVARLDSLVRDLRGKADHLEAHISEAQACDRCGQTLGEEAARRAAASFRGEADAFAYQAGAVSEKAGEIEVGDEPPAPEPIPQEIREAPAELGAARERKSILLARVAAAQEPDFLRQAAEARATLVQAETVLAGLAAVDPDEIEKVKTEGLEARAKVNEARQRHTDATADKARADQRAQQIADADQKAATTRAQIEALDQELDTLRIFDRAYGRGGIPTSYLETVALPYFETRASEILRRLGAGCRVEFRTMKENKSGTVADELHVMVILDEGYEQEFRHYSGGEKTRIGLAISLALAEFLHTRGAGSELLFLDEPSFLDSAGQEALVSILAELPIRKKMLISHDPRLGDAFDQTVTVVRDGGRSRVVDAEVPEPVAA